MGAALFLIPTPSQSEISHTLTLAIGGWSGVTSLANHMTLARSFPRFFQPVIGERKQVRRDQCLYFLKRGSPNTALEKNNTNDDRKKRATDKEKAKAEEEMGRKRRREGRRRGETVSKRVVKWFLALISQSSPFPCFRQSILYQVIYPVFFYIYSFHLRQSTMSFCQLQPQEY